MAWFRLKKSSEIIDYTDRGKNIPKIETDYKVTKEGFIEINNPEEKFISSSICNKTDNEYLINKQEKSGVLGSIFDFFDGGDKLKNNEKSQITSNFKENPNNFSESFEQEIKKKIRNLSSRTEENSNDIYKLLQRIELLERKIERLESSRI
ncbi:MAG: hypothetical protein QXJ28_01865 [Candidatus Pacearchaeota archaeon]